MSEIRVRFAPSPTGALHLGGARSAIYNWLFARAKNGKFLLRIEDTDTRRSRSEYVDQICQSLQWLGLDWDEKLLFQSKRLHEYQQAVKQLLETGNAYYCFCTPEELEKRRKHSGDYRYDGKCRSLADDEKKANLAAGRPAAVRFKIEKGATEWNDHVYGRIAVSHAEIDDFVIQRSNGIPTYQLAVVVDDIQMRISHVIRGEDHISNTPKQIQLYTALKAQVPEFAHLPLLLGTDGKRLSKRHGATGVDEYKKLGYPPEAVFNYLAILGWVPKDGNEIQNPIDLIHNFRLTDIARKSAVFDMQKFDWIGNAHIKRMANEQIYEHILPLLTEHDLIDPEQDTKQKDYILKFIDLMKSRFRTFRQFVTLGAYFFKDPAKYEEKALRKNWKSREVNERIELLFAKLAELDDFTVVATEKVVRDVAEELEISAGKLIHPLRLAVSGYSVGPGIFELLEVLGSETVLRRIQTALQKLPEAD
jgi:glutamyl-tRNA synthetase